MSARSLRLMGLGMVATAGAGLIGLTAMLNTGYAHADNIGLVIGGSGDPFPGPEYVAAANSLYLNNASMPSGPLYPDLTFYQATATNPFGNGVFTPEQLYPLFSGGAHQLYLNYPLDADGLPSANSSVGLGADILKSTIEANPLDTSVVLGYSQSSTLAGITMQLLQNDPNDVGLNPEFLLLADPSNPNGGLLERFNGFETIGGETHTLPLNLPSLGISFDGATPSDDYVTNVYTLQYDGFADFPRYPLNFLSSLNAFLGIATLHGTYLNGGVDGSGPTIEDIANAKLLDGSALLGNTDSLTNYYMIDTLGGEPVTPPLVALLPAPLQALLGPSLTYLINLGYGDGSLGYSDTPANVPTPFGLFPDVSLSDVFSNLATKTQEGLTAYEAYLAAPPDVSPVVDPGTPALDYSVFLTNLATDPTGTFTELVNAISSATSTAYTALLPTADILNALLTSVPAYELSLFTTNLANGDFVDAIGLPLAAHTAITTLAAGFQVEILQTAISQITADFSGLFS